MGKATVLNCDKCKVWDSQEKPVLTVGVAGPKLDLCTDCRAQILVLCGVNADLALRYQQMRDATRGDRGTAPGLSYVETWEAKQPVQAANGEADQGEGEEEADKAGEEAQVTSEPREGAPEEEGDNQPTEEETQPVGKPARGRASRK